MTTVAFSSAAFTATLGSTYRFLSAHVGDILNVKSFGAIGDGTTDDSFALQACLDVAFGSTGSPHSNSEGLNRGVFFPPGEYKTTTTLNVREVYSGRIFGSGKGVSRIKNTTSGNIIFATDGANYLVVQDMSFISVGGAGSICFDWGWNQTISPDVLAAECTFYNLEFNGAETGVRAGFTGSGSSFISQASESLWLNCDFLNCGLYGFRPMNFNSLNHLFYGGRCMNCGDGTLASGGLFTTTGNLPVISGMYFYNPSGSADIVHQNGDTCSIITCNSESPNFCRVGGGFNPNFYLVGNTHINTTASSGYFCILNPGSTSGVIVDGCYSANGVFTTNSSGASKLYLRNNQFGLSSAVTSFSGTIVENI